MADDPNALRENIADTRERLSNTIEEIGERLNPQVLKENVKDSIREATIGRMSTMARQAADTVSRTTSGVADTVRENPIPAAMIAVGLGWMIWNASTQRGNGSARRRSTGTDVGYGPDYAASGGGYTSGDQSSYGSPYGAPYGASYAEFGATIGGEGDFADSPSPGLTGRAKERARHLGEAAQERAGEFADRARHAADDVRDRAQAFYGTAAQATRRGATKIEDTFHENPLAIGAVAMAIGLAAGLAAPVTDREVRLMGDARDELVDKVKDVADETREKAEHVASRAMQEAKVAAKDEGLTT